MKHPTVGISNAGSETATAINMYSFAKDNDVCQKKLNSQSSNERGIVFSSKTGIFSYL